MLLYLTNKNQISEWLNVYTPLNIQNMRFFSIYLLKWFKYIHPIMNVMGIEIILLVIFLICITCTCFILMECEFCVCLETSPMSETEELWFFVCGFKSSMV